MAKKQKPKKKNTTAPKAATAKTASGLLPAFFHNKPLMCGLILAFSFLLYGNTLGHDYTQDDALVIYENMYTKQGIAGIPGILKYDTFKGFFKVEGKDKLVAGGRYRPLSLIMFAIEWQLFKKAKKDKNGQIERDLDNNIVYEGNTFIYHLGNILLYGLTGIVLYLLLLRLFKTADPTTAAFLAVATTFLFMAHPIHTEAVANIKGRDEILTLLGSLAALFYAIRSYQDKKPILMIWAAVCFFLALLAKENAITFVAIVPLVFFIFTKASMSDLFKYSVSFLGIAILFLFVRAGVLGWDFGEPSRELMNNPFLKIEGGQWVFMSFMEKMAVVFFTLGKYILLLFFPHPLTHDYYPRSIDVMGWGDWRVILAFLVHVALGVYALLGVLKKDWMSFGILFYLLTLSIVSNIVFPVGTNMSERFVFMPSVGFCFIIALLANRWVAGNENSTKQGISYSPALAGLALVLVLFTYKTIDRNKAWVDNFTLFTNDIQYSPNSAKLRNSVGAELSIKSQSESNETTKAAMLQEAIGHLQEAIRIHPTYENAFLQLGNAYNYLKQYDKAIEYYDHVLQLDPNDLNGINNKSVALRDAHRYDEALQLLDQLRSLGSPKTELDYKVAYVYEEAGKYYSSLGQQDRAISYFEKSIPLSTDKDKMTYFIGVAYSLKKNYPKAIESLEKALSLTVKEDNKVNIYRTLSSVYQEAGNPAKAAEYARLANR